jgi:myo-inositol-1(or 4)-monophosphatase
MLLDSELSVRLDFAVECVYSAGQLSLKYFREGLKAEQKSDGSPVTLADRSCEQFIRSRVDAQFPDDDFLGEEFGANNHNSLSVGRWICDPIDGTRSFVSGVPLYGVLLSFEVNQKPVLGVISLPASNELYCASSNQPTLLNGHLCKVSSIDRLSEARVCLGSLQSFKGMGWEQNMLQLAGRSSMTRGWGDAFGHMLVASGRAEAMVDPKVSRWDVSAVKIIVEQAGGWFGDESGGDGLDSGRAISSNPHLRDELFSLFPPQVNK